jgi:hypothetical protein
MTVAPHKPLMTRRQMGAFLRANGFPICDSTLTKLCAPARGEGPPVAAWLGKRALHEPDAALAWARSRLRLVPSVGTGSARRSASDLTTAATSQPSSYAEALQCAVVEHLDRRATVTPEPTV